MLTSGSVKLEPGANAHYGAEPASTVPLGLQVPHRWGSGDSNYGRVLSVQLVMRKATPSHQLQFADCLALFNVNLIKLVRI